jgi:PAS domain S-box-containing protein
LGYKSTSGKTNNNPAMSRNHLVVTGGTDVGRLHKAGHLEAPPKSGRMRRELVAGGGALGNLVRVHDWARTPLGPIESWPANLATAVSMMLNSRYPMLIWWGREDLIQIYNDAYAAMTLGDKHPWALGRSAREVYAEIWGQCAPRVDAVFRSGEATWDEDLLLILQRNGLREETYHTFSYGPILDQRGNVNGILCPVIENTRAVIERRRHETLRELAVRASEGAKSAEGVCRDALDILAGNPQDLPFVLIYLLDARGTSAQLIGSRGLPDHSPAAPARIDLTGPLPVRPAWPLTSVSATRRAEIVTDLGQRFAELPGGAWPDPPDAALVSPILWAPGHDRLAGFVVAGINPFRPLDDAYRGFFDGLARQLVTAIANARMLEEERERKEAASELNRAKTTFFSNISHEFRTPLTLMLASAEGLLAGSPEQITAVQRSRLEALRRNGFRLQKLVNNLLELSRADAGRTQVSYEPVDLASFTRELASAFGSAAEQAGLALAIDCPALDQPVYVDPDQWEKIVLNLLSNAFKFTFSGSIRVSLRSAGDRVALRVKDTGVGIPSKELPRLFSRFHRIQGTPGRTHEGSGIGLALVQELANLHGGSVDVESVAGQGSMFTVWIPKGAAHLPQDRISAPGGGAHRPAGATPYVQEALQWLPDGNTGAQAYPHSDPAIPVTILVADDNADMRNYMRRLLEPHWSVEAVEDGARALVAVRVNPPDLIIADVMMPACNGYALVRQLRADRSTAAIPVILLSARADEDGRIEGMNAGADDYLVKPFGPRELLACISAHLEIARVRRQAEQRITGILESITDGFEVIDAGWRFTYMNTEAMRMLTAYGVDPAGAIGKSLEDVFPQAQNAELVNQTRKAMAERKVISFENYCQPWNRWYAVRIYPIPDGGLARYFHDITERKQTEQQLQVLQDRLAADLDSMKRLQEISSRLVRANRSDAILPEIVDAAVAVTSADMGNMRLFDSASGALKLVAQRGFEGPFLDFFDTIQDGRTTCRSAMLKGERVIIEDVAASPLFAGTVERDQMLAAGVRGVQSTPLFSRSGPLVGILSTHYRTPRGPTARDLGFLDLLARQAADCIERIQTEEALRESEQRFRLLADGSPNIIWVTDAAGNIEFANRAYLEFFGIDRHAVARFDWQAMVHPDDRKTYIESFVTALRERQSFHGRARVRRADGRWRWIESRGNVRVNAGGGLTGYVGSSMDITDIYESREALREADRHKDEFLATLAHELRNPLAPIRNSLHVLRLSGDSSATAERMHSLMERQVNHMARLVDDLMEVSRITRGKIELHTERIELATAVNSAVETSRPLIEGAHHHLSVSLPPEPVVLEADAVRLAQVFANLLNNAAKFTDPGGEIRLVALRSADGVDISVRDTGVGIPAEMLPRIFDMFTQVDRSVGRSQGGLGIGLTLVRSLVHMHGGSVEARSDGSGRGSEFIVHLPVAPAELGGAAAAPEAPVSGLVTPYRILVVDDNQDSADSLAMLLRFLGAEVEIAYRGDEALEALDARRPAVVLLDIGMPDMDGYEVARRIRRHPTLHEVTLIALSGWGQQEDRRRSLEAGFDYHLIKPVDINALQALLASLKNHP